MLWQYRLISFYSIIFPDHNISSYTSFIILGVSIKDHITTLDHQIFSETNGGIAVIVISSILALCVVPLGLYLFRKWYQHIHIAPLTGTSFTLSPLTSSEVEMSHSYAAISNDEYQDGMIYNKPYVSVDSL